MPIYEYRCKNCGMVTEELRGIKNVKAPFQCIWCRYVGGSGENIISSSHFSFPGGLPSYDNEVHIDE